MTLARKLVAVLNRRFEKYHLVYPNAMCTFVDPRYNTIFFNEIVSAIAADEQLARASAQGEGLEVESTSSTVAHASGVSDDRTLAIVPSSRSEAKSNSSTVDPLWGDFDKRVTASRSVIAVIDSSASFDNEIKFFLKELPIRRHGGCPLKWWQQNEARLSLLATLARALLAVPATSVNSERLK